MICTFVRKSFPGGRPRPDEAEPDSSKEREKKPPGKTVRRKISTFEDIGTKSSGRINERRAPSSGKSQHGPRGKQFDPRFRSNVDKPDQLTRLTAGSCSRGTSSIVEHRPILSTKDGSKSA